MDKTISNDQTNVTLFNDNIESNSQDIILDPSVSEVESTFALMNQNSNINILDRYFKLSRENNIAIFYDKDQKHFIMAYNDNILDDSRNIFIGYRSLEDVLAKREKNTIRICSRRQFEKRVENKRYVYSGFDPNFIIVLLKFVQKNKLNECLSVISRNWEILNEKYISKTK